MHREHAAQHSSLQARTEGRYSWDINVEVNQGQTDCRAQNLLQKGWKVKVSAAMSISVITVALSATSDPKYTSLIPLQQIIREIIY